MKIAICLIIKNENQYLKEWLTHYKNIGVDHFFIYDNGSKNLVIEEFDKNYTEDYEIYPQGQVFCLNSDITIIKWDYDNKIGSQLRAYLHCCKNNQDYDYILFVDTDEFLILKNHKTIQDFVKDLKIKHDEFDGLGIYWRMYGKSNPYYENRMKYTDYNEYSVNNHIKSLINPKKVINFPDPHKTVINGKYIDELGRIITSPIGNHTSENIYIKHIWTRSLIEFEEKIKRGCGDKVKRNWQMKHFYEYNDNLNERD